MTPQKHFVDGLQIQTLAVLSFNIQYAASAFDMAAGISTSLLQDHITVMFDK